MMQSEALGSLILVRALSDDLDADTRLRPIRPPSETGRLTIVRREPNPWQRKRLYSGIFSRFERLFNRCSRGCSKPPSITTPNGTSFWNPYRVIFQKW